MQIFTTIVILIVMLGILVSSHEAGHLAMAKAFNVYCLEYSIGFGPKLFSHRKKGHETAFSLRAFPLGGYVSMYGEGVELPKGVLVPEERSLNGVAPWKRSMILSAGIIVNFFLSILFIFIFALCIPSYYSAQYIYTGLNSDGSVYEGSVPSESLAVTGLWGGGTFSFTQSDGSEATYRLDETDRLYAPDSFGLTLNKTTHSFYIVDPQAEVDGVKYVACFDMQSVSSNNFASCLAFFPQKDSFYVSAAREAIGLTAFPDLASDPLTVSADMAATLHLSVVKSAGGLERPSIAQFQARKSYEIHSKATSATAWSGLSFHIDSYQYWKPFGERLSLACAYYANFFRAIGEGFANIFGAHDFSQVGSIVLMGSVINQEAQSIGVARTFFIYGGYLSLSLAIFNLLPFPGLDGWQLLVTLIEKVSKRKISNKVKNIVSAVGLALLFAFSIVIIIKDVIQVVA